MNKAQHEALAKCDLLQRKIDELNRLSHQAQSDLLRATDGLSEEIRRDPKAWENPFYEDEQ